MLEELQAQVPASVLTLLRIPGMGPKKAAALHKELGITSLDDLRAACEAHRVRELKGFGEKTEETILAGLRSLARQKSSACIGPRPTLRPAAAASICKQCKAFKQIEMAGSYRRGRETIGDFDLLVDADDRTQ